MHKTLLSFGKAMQQLADAGTALIAAAESLASADTESAPAAPAPSTPAPAPPSEAVEATVPDCSPSGPSIPEAEPASEPADADPDPASEPRQRASVSMTRSAFAQLVFPRMSRHQAGLAVAGVIMSNQHLLARLKKVGYRPNQVGYSLPQLEILCEYFKITLP